MSGIAGVFHLDGRPAAATDVAAMTATMAHRGPDGIGHWASGPVALGHCALKTTPQALGETQPLRAEAADLCLTMDGRVDNRDELRRALGPAGAAPGDGSDAELVLRCYQRWGTGCVVRILGDFAFALWDGARRQLVCARDFRGRRPFYYSTWGGSFRFASEPQAVLADRALPREPNEGMVAELLSIRPMSTSETLFEHLLRLPAAHLAVITPLGTRISRYWDWDPAVTIRYRDDRDYAVHLLDLCSTALEPRLLGPSPVAVALSGGVDSSSLVGLVQHLRREGRSSSSVEVFSLVFPGQECDESPHIRAVARHHNLVVHEIEGALAGAAPYEAQARQHLDLPDFPITMMHRSLWAAAREHGCRVILTGNGPDEWLTGSPLSLADDLRQGRLLRAGDRLRLEAAGGGRTAAAWYLWTNGVRPFVPASAVAGLRRATRRSDLPDHLPDAFCRRTHLEDRVRRPPLHRGPSRATAYIAQQLYDGWPPQSMELSNRAMGSVGLESRHPFDDRRVVEYALALPDDQRRRGDVTKFVLRQGMTGLVPESVLFAEALRLQGGEALFEDLGIAERGWIDGQRVRAMYAAFDRNYREGNVAYHRHLWQLWVVAAVQRWSDATWS
jgi:asparagine synthase (glutamine-hydrolysing)